MNASATSRFSRVAGPLLRLAGSLVLGLLLVLPSKVGAQSLDLTVNNVGLSIGDSEEVTGVRLNFRDRNLRRVTGLNATIWTPHNEHGGDVTGIALGLPATGGDNISGIAFGILGVGANETMTGIAFGGLGVGAGRDVIERAEDSVPDQDVISEEFQSADWVREQVVTQQASSWADSVPAPGKT
ncbi:MAG: hypothetical protein ACPG3U_02010 [Rhodothermales bacterium]